MSARPGSRTVHVLREDPDLSESIPAQRRHRAIEECTALEMKLPTGRWAGGESSIPEAGIGLLVLEGLLIRRVGVDGRYGAELLGEGDVLRPWQGEDEMPALHTTTGWSVIEPTRVALLDAQFAAQVGRYPELAGRLVGRAVRRSRTLAVNMAIVHHARVDTRLHMLFWHLAGRWGKVRSDGTILPLRLTHTVLAELVAARRPTVSGALSDLARRGLVRLLDEGWLLSGDPPGELLVLAPAPTSSNGIRTDQQHS